MGCMRGQGGCAGRGCTDMEVVHARWASPFWVKSIPNPCHPCGAAAPAGAWATAERHSSLLAGTSSSAKGPGQRLLPLAMGDRGDASDGEQLLHLPLPRVYPGICPSCSPAHTNTRIPLIGSSLSPSWPPLVIAGVRGAARRAAGAPHSPLLRPNPGQGGPCSKTGCSPHLGKAAAGRPVLAVGWMSSHQRVELVHPKNAITASLALNGFVGSRGRSSLAAHRLWENSFQGSPQSGGKPAFFFF